MCAAPNYVRVLAARRRLRDNASGSGGGEKLTLGFEVRLEPALRARLALLLCRLFVVSSTTGAVPGRVAGHGGPLAFNPGSVPRAIGARPHTPTHTRARTCMPAHTRTHTHTRAHTHAHTHTHTYARTHARTHTQQAQRAPSEPRGAGVCCMVPRALGGIWGTGWWSTARYREHERATITHMVSSR